MVNLILQGSGKTLAFGLPVLQRILETKLKGENSNKISSKGDQGVLALILAPTRELALQVHKNLQDVAKAISIKVSIGTILCRIYWSAIIDATLPVNTIADQCIHMVTCSSCLS